MCISGFNFFKPQQIRKLDEAVPLCANQMESSFRFSEIFGTEDCVMFAGLSDRFDAFMLGRKL